MFSRIALRRLRNAPAFCLTVVGLVAVTVGACVLLVTVAARTLLVPSTRHEPERLVRIFTTDETRSRNPAGVYGRSSLPDLRAMQDAVAERASLAAFATYPMAARVGTDDFTVPTSIVTPSYFSVAGVAPQLGDVAHDAEPGAVISHDLWVRRFGRSSAVLGSPIRLGAISLAVRAVMPDGFVGTDYARETDVWVPVSVALAMLPREPDPTLYHDDRRFSVIGRLAVGATTTGLEPGLRAAALDLQQREPVTNARRGFLVVPFPRLVGVAERSTLGIDRALLSGAVLVAALVLLAYANLANLFAVRALLGAREVAIRKALGGSDRELLADSLGQVAFLVAPGVLLGWMVARLAFSIWFARSPLLARSGMPIDPLTVVGLLTLGFVATLALGAVPAWWARSQSPGAALREADGDTPLRNARVLWGLVAVQVAIASCAGGLVYGGLSRVRALESVVTGFDLDHIIDAPVKLRIDGIGPLVHDEVIALVERVERMDGVEAAAVGEVTLLSGRPLRMAIGLGGRTFPPSETPSVRFDVVTPDYFSTLGLAMQLGGFSADVVHRATRDEIVVNRAFADAYLEPGREIGATVLMRERFPIRVVGIVQNATTDALVGVEEPRMYLPHYRDGPITSDIQLVVRTRGRAEEFAPLLAQTLAADRAVETVGRIEPLSARRERLIAPLRALSQMMGVIGGAVTILVTIGAYGLLAVSITSVRRSTAIRVALGASPPRVVLACVRPLLITFGVGTIGAVAVAASAQRLSMEAGISIIGVLATLPFLAAPMAMASAALLRRMLRRSPAEVLRV